MIYVKPHQLFHLQASSMSFRLHPWLYRITSGPGHQQSTEPTPCFQQCSNPNTMLQSFKPTAIIVLRNMQKCSEKDISKGPVPGLDRPWAENARGGGSLPFLPLYQDLLLSSCPPPQVCLCILPLAAHNSSHNLLQALSSMALEGSGQGVWGQEKVWESPGRCPMSG